MLGVVGMKVLGPSGPCGLVTRRWDARDAPAEPVRIRTIERTIELVRDAPFWNERKFRVARSG